MLKPARNLQFTLLSFLLLLPACAKPTITPAPQPEGDPSKYASYPSQLPFGPDLDIVVTRELDEIVLTNRTPRAYRDVNLWLNRQFGARLPEIPITTQVRIALTRFQNRHGESFPIAEFLAPDRADDVVLAEMVVAQPATEVTIQPTAQRHHLLVRN